MIGWIRFYQVFARSLFGGVGNCRFDPTCSEYSRQCFEKFNFLKALILTLKRLFKCHPFGPFGFDPIPKKEINYESK